MESCCNCGEELTLVGEYSHCCSCGGTDNPEMVNELVAALAEKNTRIEALEAGLDKIMQLEPCDGDCLAETCPSGLAQKTLGHITNRTKRTVCDSYEREKLAQKRDERIAELIELGKELYTVAQHFGPEAPDHVCSSPDAQCDCACVEFAAYCDILARFRTVFSL